MIDIYEQLKLLPNLMKNLTYDFFNISSTIFLSIKQFCGISKTILVS